MSFFNQHLEFKVDFDKNFDLYSSSFRPILDELFQKYYPLYQSSSVIHLLNIDDETIKFLDANSSSLIKIAKEIRPIKCEALTISINSNENKIVVFTSNVTFCNKDNNFIFIRQTKSKLRFHIKDKYEIFINNEFKGKYVFLEATLDIIS